MRRGWLLGSTPAKRRALVGLLVACGMPAALARAQAQGGLGLTPNELGLSFSLGKRFTNNAGLVAGAGGSDADSITDLRADLIARRSSPRTEWSARYDPFYTRYERHDQFDTTNHALEFNGRYLVTRNSRLSLLESFFYSRNPLQIGIAEPANEAIILTRETKRWRSFTDAAIDTSLSRSLILQVGASARFERLDLSPPVDINTYSGRLGVQKRVGRSDGISVTSSYSRFAFPLEGNADAEAQGMDVSWSHGAPALINGVVSVGAGLPVRTDWSLSAGLLNVVQGRDRQNRLTAGASLHHAFRRLDFDSGYRRSLGADAGVATVTLAQSAYAGVSGRIGRLASLAVRGEYGTRDSLLGSGDRVALSYAGGAIQGAIAINPRLSVSAEARRRKQDVTAGSGEALTVDTLFLGLIFRAL
jgi:hypothetical protein